MFQSLSEVTENATVYIVRRDTRSENIWRAENCICQRAEEWFTFKCLSGKPAGSSQQKFLY